MVKPGYPYLDVVRDGKELVGDVPMAIYQVLFSVSVFYLF